MIEFINFPIFGQASNDISWLQVIVPAVVSVALASLAAMLVLAKYQNKVDNLEKQGDKHEAKIDDLKDRVSKLEGGIERDRANDPYTQRKSPVSLTDKGKALLLDSGGQKYIDKNEVTLVGGIQTKKPKSAYDVQEYAKAVIQAHTDDDEFTPLKNYLFKEGLKLDDLVNVLGIALRDKALAKLGYKLQQVDESDPNTMNSGE